jgi:hypothetical protein
MLLALNATNNIAGFMFPKSRKSAAEFKKGQKINNL